MDVGNIAFILIEIIHNIDLSEVAKRVTWDEFTIPYFLRESEKTRNCIFQPEKNVCTRWSPKVQGCNYNKGPKKEIDLFDLIKVKTFWQPCKKFLTWTKKKDFFKGMKLLSNFYIINAVNIYDPLSDKENLLSRWSERKKGRGCSEDGRGGRDIRALRCWAECPDDWWNIAQRIFSQH
jgi:hypothetical protein